jgi:hypothetical protein
MHTNQATAKTKTANCARPTSSLRRRGTFNSLCRHDFRNKRQDVLPKRIKVVVRVDFSNAIQQLSEIAVTQSRHLSRPLGFHEPSGSVRHLAYSIKHFFPSNIKTEKP